MAGIQKKSGPDSYLLVAARSPPPATAGTQWDKQATLSPGLLSQWFPPGSASRNELKLLYHEVHGRGTGQTVAIEKDPLAWLQLAFKEQRVALYLAVGGEGGGGGGGGSTAKAAATGPAVAAQAVVKDKQETEKSQETHRFAIELLDEDDQPVEGVEYEITFADGAKFNNTTNAMGRAYFPGIAPGTVTVAFPKMDGEIWEPLKDASL